LIDPIYEYPHSLGESVTGGFVYRGSALGAAYRGRYFFADFISGRVWSMALAIDEAGQGHAGEVVEHTSELGAGATLDNISSFGVDSFAELYLVGYSRGVVLKLLPGTAGETSADRCRTRACGRAQ
jgi:hypothetical protein